MIPSFPVKILKDPQSGKLEAGPDRYSKAIEQLGSDKLDVRIGGIYALERVARDSPRDHPTIMEVLAAFIREHSREQWPPAEDGAKPPDRLTRPDIQAAATVIGRRTTDYDSQPINLAEANLTRIVLGGADLTRADLTRADLTRADLTRADLTRAGLSRANLFRADLTDARLINANLTGADLTRAVLIHADLTDAHLTDAQLISARPIAARLIGADLTHANLFVADLTGADLTRANLTDANIVSANLTGTDLARANPTDANLTHANLTDALWPSDAAVPDGWQRDGDSPRLKRSQSNPGDPAA